MRSRTAAGARVTSGEDGTSGAGMTDRAQMTLATIGQGIGCQVRDVLGDDAISTRLLEMGVVPGTAVTVVGSAMSGDPIELSVRNYRLTIRRREAERVIVDLVPE